MTEAISASKTIRRSASRSALFVYKQVLSPLLHAVSGSAGSCRFQPTCSEYAFVAIDTHGAFRGSWLALRRLAKCHPLHPPAFDPVPMQSSQPPFTIEEQVSHGPAASPPLSQPPHERR